DFSKYAENFGGFDSGGSYSTGFGGGMGDSGFSDFFEMLFPRSAGSRGRNPYYSGGRTSTVPRQGEDYKQEIDVTLEEAFAGGQRVLQMEVPEACPTCNGSGLTGNKVCPTCQGAGTVYRSKRLEVKI